MIRIVTAALLLCSPLAGQQQPAIRFDFSFPGSVPSKYSIVVSASGDVSFDEPANDKQEPYHSDFHLSSEKTEHLFASATALHNFQPDFDYRNHKIAETGEKVLTFTKDGKSTSTTYHYSRDPQVQQITAWFQGVAETQDFARKAKFDRRFDKLALDTDVNGFLQAVKSSRATEVQSIRPILQELADDPALMRIVRERIQSLLQP